MFYLVAQSNTFNSDIIVSTVAWAEEKIQK